MSFDIGYLFSSPRYGLAPNYGCCTANFNQGWPKFTQYVVMELNSGCGLVVATYAPVSIQHTLSSVQKVTPNMKTDYPFDETVTIDVGCDVSMDMSLLVPSWTKGPTLSVNHTFPQTLKPGEVYVGYTQEYMKTAGPLPHCANIPTTACLNSSLKPIIMSMTAYWPLGHVICLAARPYHNPYSRGGRTGLIRSLIGVAFFPPNFEGGLESRLC